MTGITFFALNSIQRDAGMNDTRYARDLGLLLSGNVTELVANNQKKEIYFAGIYFRNDIGHQVRKNYSKEN